MPLFSITTSAPPPAPARRTKILADLSALLARELGKPEAYVMVALGPPVQMSFARDASQPACYAELKSVGKLTPQRMGELSNILCRELATGFGVSTDRIYIEFTNASGAEWGWNGTTFA